MDSLRKDFDQDLEKRKAHEADEKIIFNWRIGSESSRSVRSEAVIIGRTGKLATSTCQGRRRKTYNWLVSEHKADKIPEDVDGMLAENAKSIAFEELGETNSLLVEGLDELKLSVKFFQSFD